MPMAGQREHFIPLRKSELVDLLCSDKEVPVHDGEVKQFREFCRHLGEHFHLAYYRHHERMKDCYAPFDPDSEAVTLVRLDGQERAARLDRLFRELAWLVDRGNFREMSVEEIHAAMTETSSYGVNLDVAFEAFERLQVFCRGDAMMQRTRRRLRNLFRLESFTFPIFRRLVVIVKQQPHERYEPGADFRSVFIKLFKDTPKADIEMLLPAGRLKMPKMQKGKIGASLVTTIGFVGYKIFTEVHKLLTWNPFAFFVPLSIIFGYGYRQYFGYQRVRQGYSLQLTRSLYLQNLDNNLGAISRLLDEAEEQECREAILAYFLLWRLAADNGLTEAELDAAVEAWFSRRIRIQVDFEAHDALDKLRRLNLLTEQDRRFRVVPLDEAMQRVADADADFVAAHEPAVGVLNRESA
jgi:hypothetical protein